MISKWLKKGMREDGFTLLEAILTVVIVGIAVIPISIVFTQTVFTTIGTRKQLDANEMAQSYAEQIRGMTFDEFYAIFPSSSDTEVTLDGANTVDFENVGLKPIKKGYALKVSYDTTTDLPAYSAPSDNSVSNIDGTISIPSDYKKSVSIKDASDNEKVDKDKKENIGTKIKTIKITTLRSSPYYQIDIIPELSGGGIISCNTITYSANPKIKIVLGDDATSGAGSNYDINLQVDSNITEEISIYIYESENSPIKLLTQTVNGYVSYSRNLTEGNSDDRIIDVGVSIINAGTNETMADIVTTKVKE